MKTPTIMVSDQNHPAKHDGAADQEFTHDPLDPPRANPILQAMPVTVSQSGKSRLELLPDELLAMVIGQVAPADHSLNGTQAYRANQEILRSLCLVSKTVEGNVRPALYRDVRLHENMAVVHLCATLCANPTLGRHVKSIVLNPHQDPRGQQICAIDLTPLRPFQDDDYKFWIRGKGKAECRMPRRTRDELICTLFSKILSRIPALESLSFRLPALGKIQPECMALLSNKVQFTNQLMLHQRLFRDFYQGNTVPDFSNLKTVGILGGVPRYFAMNLCTKLFRQPSVRTVFWSSVDGKSAAPEDMDGGIWQHTLSNAQLYSIGSRISYAWISTAVKNVELRSKCVSSMDIARVGSAFPSLESLTIDNCYFEDKPHNMSAEHGHNLYRVLGELENFNTFVLDVNNPEVFTTANVTASGPSKLFKLSALSKLHTLLVPVDLVVCFTQDKDLKPLIQRTTTILPDSLRHLTLLLNYECKERLAWEGTGSMQMSRVTNMVGPFLREVAPLLLVDFPHLEEIDLCYDMDDYRQNKVHLLASRFTAVAEAAF
ncbi:hypothetical protein INS49_015810 [Diaporthe citri]|uniref:uncharacterized protein n=1 Tax=Diaporthe citri TaxID=83186 RepID=UPI001C81EEAB|nr:uncharacterized protein INS49_015810 [Diaporthe citri]KAG6356422.1 hypothetical protein INS49_015810 [Diaporthe citri]